MTRSEIIERLRSESDLNERLALCRRLQPSAADGSLYRAEQVLSQLRWLHGLDTGDGCHLLVSLETEREDTASVVVRQQATAAPFAKRLTLRLVCDEHSSYSVLRQSGRGIQVLLLRTTSKAEAEDRVLGEAEALLLEEVTPSWATKAKPPTRGRSES